MLVQMKCVCAEQTEDFGVGSVVARSHFAIANNFSTVYELAMVTVGGFYRHRHQFDAHRWRDNRIDKVTAN